MELKSDVSHASIDICTKCQLRCVSCSTSKGIIRNGFVREGCMTFHDFACIVDANPEIKHIELSNWGEIFLNPDILRIMEYAFAKGISLYCSNGSNFNYVPDEVLEGLVKYQFKCLNLSIDGATQETYSQYRIKGNLENVLSNIRKLNWYKVFYRSEFPKLSWQFIIFGHNEHEIAQVKRLCNELGMAFNPKMNHSDFSPVINTEKIKEETGLAYASREEYRRIYGTEYKHPCYQCLFSPQINWNGEVLGCCVNKWKSLGNAKTQTLHDIMDSDLYQSMIQFLFGNGPLTESMPCYDCPNLQKVKEQPLTLNGLKKYSEYEPVALR